MKYSNINQVFYNGCQLPKEIETSLKDMLGVKSLSDLEQSQRQSLRLDILNLFKGKNTTYYNRHLAYAIYYLPANFSKIWKPLYDLLIKNQIKQDVSILELGVGPGSTTFGIIEFYKVLALENPDAIFNLRFILVEKEIEFKKIFEKLFEEYKTTIPTNLQVDIRFKLLKVDENFQVDDRLRFDIIVESNMLNPNEQINDDIFIKAIYSLNKNLNKHASIILIEPASELMSGYLYKLKQKIIDDSLYGIFSPCSCDNRCKQLSMAQIDISNSSLIKELRDNAIITNEKNKHYFEYLVLRNDRLKNHVAIDNKVKLYDLNNCIGKEINLSGYIIYSKRNSDKVSIKICDGSLNCRKDVWINISNEVLKFNNLTDVDVERGDLIKLKRVFIEDSSNLVCGTHTDIEIRR